MKIIKRDGHIVGNKLIQERTGCKIFAHKIEKSFTENPILEPAFLYGGYPFKDIRNKFLMAKESVAVESENNLPEGLESMTLKGHFFDMIGIKTSDDVYFLADSLFSKETINKYSLFFVYDVQEFLNTLDYLKQLKGKIYVPSHCEATNDISELINLNKEKVQEIAEKICNFCGTGKNFEEILKNIFDEYNLTMNVNQYILVASTVKSYLSYLYDSNKITYSFENNTMLWRKKIKRLVKKSSIFIKNAAFKKFFYHKFQLIL